MASEETAILNKARLEASARGDVLMKNVRGNFRTMDGKRIVAAGISAKGSSDLIGWRTVEITQDMVGQKVAVYLAVEVKTRKGKVSPEQQHFLDVVNEAGGIGIVYRGD